MVIFGAGASHDSFAGQTDITPPPLTKQLVEPAHYFITNEYPLSSAVVDYVHRESRGGNTTSLERILAGFANQASVDPRRLKQLVAFRFYLTRLLREETNAWLKATSGITNYLSLLNYLSEWQQNSGESICLVTFNYDTLIENALSRMFTPSEWAFASFDSYLDGDQWSLLKLHGSITWSREVSEPRGSGVASNAERAVDAASQLTHRTRFVMRSALEPDTPGGKAYIPAIAVPLEDKTSFECPIQHIDWFGNSIPRIDRLLICGWRAAEHHAVEILSQLSPGYELGIVVGGEHPKFMLEEIKANLRAAGNKGNLVVGETGGMTALVQNLKQLRPLLARR